MIEFLTFAAVYAVAVFIGYSIGDFRARKKMEKKNALLLERRCEVEFWKDLYEDLLEHTCEDKE